MMQCELMLQGVERLRSESPRFWTDEELDEAIAQDVQALHRTVETRTFADGARVEREVTQSLMNFDADVPGVYEGRCRSVHISEMGAFFGKLSTQASCSESQESIAGMLELSEYLAACAKWLSEEP